MKPLLSAILLVACSPPPDCVSPCGVPLYGSQDCEGFAAAESRAVRALSTVPEFSGRDLCSDLSVVAQVRITPPGELLKHGNAGFTYWSIGGSAYIELDGSYGWRDGAFTHECAHSFIGYQGGHPYWGCEIRNAEPDCREKDRGIYSAIEQSRTLP